MGNICNCVRCAIIIFREMEDAFSWTNTISHHGTYHMVNIWMTFVLGQRIVTLQNKHKMKQNVHEIRAKVHYIGKWNGLKGPCIKFRVFDLFHCTENAFHYSFIFEFPIQIQIWAFARMDFIHCGTFSLKMNHIEEASAVQKIYVYSENCNRNELKTTPKFIQQNLIRFDKPIQTK